MRQLAFLENVSDPDAPTTLLERVANVSLGSSDLRFGMVQYGPTSVKLSLVLQTVP